MKCDHEGCDGEIIEKDTKNTERKNVYQCNKCGCIFCFTVVRKDVNCPSLKGILIDEKVAGEGTGGEEWQKPLKRRRGRPKGSKNKK